MSSGRMEIYVPLVRDFAARVVLFHQTVAEKLGLNVSDLKVLRLLERHAMTAGQLAENTGLTGAAVTALIDRLEASGYVTRERDERDRRRVTVRALPAKTRKLDRLYDGLNAEMLKLLSRYSAAEFSAVTDYLSQAARILAEQGVRLRGETTKTSGE